MTRTMHGWNNSIEPWSVINKCELLTTSSGFQPQKLPWANQNGERKTAEGYKKQHEIYIY